MNYIHARTGAVKIEPKARKPNEITIKIGEQASNVTRFGGDTFKLLKIEKDSVLFYHVNVSRGGKSSERDIIVSAYQTPGKVSEPGVAPAPQVQY